MRRPVRTRRRRSGPLLGVLAVGATLSLGLSGCQFVPIPGVSSSCPITPANAFWRTDVSTRPVHASSGTWVSSIGSTRSAHADFGSGLWDGGPIGIPYNVVPGTQAGVTVTFDYADESDAGPYPIPASPKIEGGAGSTGDRHVLMVDKDNCRLYELWSAYPNGDGTWNAGSGAIWDMKSNTMRPDGWTSSDAAGLQVLPGLVRYEEVQQGKVLHAIRMTVPTTQRAYVWPASHQAGSTNSAAYPPMGAWVRLKSTVDETTFPQQMQPIIKALKTYGAVIADNGSAWYFSGAPDERWDNDQLTTMGRLKGSDFEFVDTTGLQVAPGSYQSATAR